MPDLMKSFQEFWIRRGSRFDVWFIIVGGISGYCCQASRAPRSERGGRVATLQKSIDGQGRFRNHNGGFTFALAAALLPFKSPALMTAACTKCAVELTVVLVIIKYWNPTGRVAMSDPRFASSNGTTPIGQWNDKSQLTFSSRHL